MSTTRRPTLAGQCSTMFRLLNDHSRVIEHGAKAARAEIAQAQSWDEHRSSQALPAAVRNLQDASHLLRIIRFREPISHSWGYLLPIVAAWLYFMTTGELSLQHHPDTGLLGMWTSWMGQLGFAPLPALILAALVVGLLVQLGIQAYFNRRHATRVNAVIDGAQRLSELISDAISGTERQAQSHEQAERLDSVVSSLRELVERLEGDSTPTLVQVQEALNSLGATIHRATETLASGGEQMDRTAQALGATLAALDSSANTWGEAAEQGGKVLGSVATSLAKLGSQLDNLPDTGSLTQTLGILAQLAKRADAEAVERCEAMQLLRNSIDKLEHSAGAMTHQVTEFVVPALGVLDGVQEGQA